MTAWDRRFIGAGLGLWTALASAAPEPEIRAIPGQFIVRHADASGAKVSLRAQLSRHGMRVLREISSEGLFLVETSGDKAALASLRGVDHVEPNYVITADHRPDDPEFFRLYGLENTGQTRGLAGADIGATIAWDVTRGSRDVRVAVLDTGIDFAHPDLASNIFVNAGETGADDQGRDKQSNGVDDDANGYVDDWHGWDLVSGDNDPQDDHGHGTHCAGIIGAVGGNGIGVTGVNWQVSLVPIKFLDRYGSGTLAGLIEALAYARVIGAHVTSNSFSFRDFSPSLTAAMTAATEAGIVMVSSSGSRPSDGTSAPAIYPADFQTAATIAVGASDHADLVPSWARIGPVTTLVAPGVKIYSTTPGGGYGYRTGASSATPFVAGAAALVKAADPTLNASQIVERLVKSSKPILGIAAQTGGRLALAHALQDDVVAPAAVANVRVAVAARDSLTIEWDAAGDDGISGNASSYEVRYAPAPITTEELWTAATVAGTITGGGLAQLIPGLSFNTEIYVAVRARDDFRNLSPLSEPLRAAARKMTLTAEHTGASTEGLGLSGTWGVQETPAELPGEDGTSTTELVFSDSPDGNYSEMQDSALTLPSVSTVGVAALFVELRQRHTLEPSLDYGAVEASSDGGAVWQELLRVTGRRNGFETAFVQVPAALLGGDVTIRFRLVSDGGDERDGWLLKNVRLWTEREGVVR